MICADSQYAFLYGLPLPLVVLSWCSITAVLRIHMYGCMHVFTRASYVYTVYIRILCVCISRRLYVCVYYLFLVYVYIRYMYVYIFFCVRLYKKCIYMQRMQRKKSPEVKWKSNICCLCCPQEMMIGAVIYCFLRATITTCSPSMTLHYMWYMNTYVRMHACVYTCFLCIYGIYIHTLCVCISFSIFIFFLWMYMYVYIGVCCTYFLCVGVYKSTFVCFLAYTWIFLIMPPPLSSIYFYVIFFV